MSRWRGVGGARDARCGARLPAPPAPSDTTLAVRFPFPGPAANRATEGQARTCAPGPFSWRRPCWRQAPAMAQSPPPARGSNTATVAEFGATVRHARDRPAIRQGQRPVPRLHRRLRPISRGDDPAPGRASGRCSACPARRRRANRPPPASPPGRRPIRNRAASWRSMASPAGSSPPIPARSRPRGAARAETESHDAQDGPSAGGAGPRSRWVLG